MTFADDIALATTATFSASGSYVLELSASDGQLTSTSTVSVTVLPAPPVNKAPVVSAGANQTITLPASAQLSGAATDDGLPNPPGKLSITWSQVSGPGKTTFSNASSLTTSASFSQAGTYVLQLTASDSQLSSSSNVTVNLLAQTNKAPVVSAGKNQTITLPAGANLSGSVTDDGLPNPPGAVTVSWTEVSGPGTVTFADPASASTTASFGVAGSYVLQLTGNDSQLSSSSRITITVQAAQTPPQTPVLVSPSDSQTGVPLSAKLAVDVNDPDKDKLTVNFFGRAISGNFSIVVLPDTQFYSASLFGGGPDIFNSQTSWIVANRAALNVAYVAHLGDIVQDGDTDASEWQNADTAMKKLESPSATGLAEGIPYGVAVGNHDQTPEGDAAGTTALFNQFFGLSRFSSRSYYGGHFGSDNNNHYDLFSAGGMDFVVVYVEYDPTANPDVLAWANSIIQHYSNRRAIVVSHYIILNGDNASFGTQGLALYNALKDNPNLFLMLCGHVVQGTEGAHISTFNGNSIYTLMSDYQSLANGGSGWLRIIQFLPSVNQIEVSTYSPWLNQSETTSSGHFTLPYAMQGSTTTYSRLGADTTSGSSGTANFNWTGLNSNTTYEWYVTVSDGVTTVTSPTWTFTTGAN